MSENKVGQIVIDWLAQLDASRLEQITKDTHKTVPTPLSQGLVQYAEAIFDRYALKQCFPDRQADIKKMIALYVALRDELVREKLRSVKIESDKGSLVDACLTGDMQKIESVLIVLGYKSLPGASLLQ